MAKTFLITLAVLLFLPNLFNLPVFLESGYNHKEDYDSSFSYLNTPEKLNHHIDSVLAMKKITTGSYECVFEISSIISRRFYHGYSHFSLADNWIAAISGKLIDSGMACKVHPETILQNQHAACSQQAIVMMSMLRRKGISYRHLGFPHHYALDVLIGDKWYYFDPNREPVMNKEQRSETNWQYQMDSLKPYYHTNGKADVEQLFGNGGVVAQKGSINEIPAPNARLFQTATGILSKTLWSFPLLLLFFRSRKYFPFNKDARQLSHGLKKVTGEIPA